MAGGGGQFPDGGLEIPVIVNVADDVLGNPALFVCKIRVTNLLQQDFRQRHSSRERVEHELAFFLLLRRAAADGVYRRKLVAPLLLHLNQLVEFRLEIVRRRLDLPFRSSLKRRFGGRVLVLRHGLVLQFGFRCANLLKHGILL